MKKYDKPSERFSKNKDSRQEMQSNKKRSRFLQELAATEHLYSPE